MKAVLALVVLVVIGGAGWYVYDKNHNKNTSDSSQASSDSSVTPSGTQSEPSASSAAVITTKTDSKVGKYLADGNGSTLYTYGPDKSGVSNCSGSCLYDWPVYASIDGAKLPADVATIKRADGDTQYTYKGMPLYYFSSDTQAGQVTGDGVSDFHVAKP